MKLEIKQSKESHFALDRLKDQSSISEFFTPCGIHFGTWTIFDFVKAQWSTFINSTGVRINEYESIKLRYFMRTLLLFQASNSSTGSWVPSLMITTSGSFWHHKTSRFWGLSFARTCWQLEFCGKYQIRMHQLNICSGWVKTCEFNYTNVSFRRHQLIAQWKSSLWRIQCVKLNAAFFLPAT